MGTISDKLMRIINTKEDIRQALISKGYDVPTSIPFKEYAKMILDLPCHAESFPDIEGIVARYSASGLTNEQMAANPVWVDKTGNGHDLQMKNFAWKGMSGVGGYVTNKDIYEYDLDRYSYIFIESSTKVHDFYIVFELIGYDENFKDGFNLDVRSISQGLKYRKTYTKNGIYIFQYKDEEGLDDLFAVGYNGNGGARSNFTVKILPLYPGFILGDGVDDFAVTEKELNFQDTYTVYTAFIPFQDDPARTMSLCGKDRLKDFYMYYSNLDSIGFFSVDKAVSTLLSNGFNLIVCKKTSDKMLIKNLITGKVAEVSVDDLIYNPGLYYLWRSATIANYSKTAIAGQVICNGHFTTDEEDEKVLNWHKKQYPWLFPDQAWTVVGKTNEDEDRATIANITGNGNNLVLSNFAFSGNSGYGLYNIQKFTNWSHVADRGDIVKNGYSVTITNSKITGSSTNYNTDILYSYNSSSTTIIFKVTGLVDGQKIFLGRKSVTDAYVIDKDGIYRSDYNIPQEDGKVIVGIGTVGFTGECNITIEQIPEYEGYLVTDGVDDKAVSKQFKFGENFTVILDFKFPVKKISYCGFDLSSKVRIQNLQGSGVYVVLKGNRTLIPSNVVRAVTSEGKVYDENWNEYNIVPGNISSNYTMVNLGFDGSNQFAESATKLAGIYSSILSKDECIKAYNYLQTLKSK